MFGRSSEFSALDINGIRGLLRLFVVTDGNGIRIKEWEMELMVFLFLYLFFFTLSFRKNNPVSFFVFTLDRPSYTSNCDILQLRLLYIEHTPKSRSISFITTSQLTFVVSTSKPLLSHPATISLMVHFPLFPFPFLSSQIVFSVWFCYSLI